MARLDYVADVVRTIFREMTPGVPTGIPQGPWFARKGQGSLFLDEDDATAYRAVVGRLTEEQAKRGIRASPSNMETLLQDVLFTALEPRSESGDEDAFERRLAKAMATLGRRLSEPPRDFTWHIPILGVADDGLPVSVGTVRLVRMNAVRMRRLLFPRDLQLSDEDKAGRQKLLRSLKEEEWLGQAVAVVSVQAGDPEAARRLAENDVREVVDILNFFADLAPNNPAWVYLAGEAAREITTAVVTGPNGFVTISGSVKGPLAPLSVRRLRTTPRVRSSFQRVNVLLKEEPRSPIAQLLITSLRWAGRASVEPVPEQSFLQYVIALEALILPTDTLGIKHRLQTRIAHLLADRVRDRAWYYDNMRRLYEVRNDIAHDGSVAVSEADLGMLKAITKSCIEPPRVQWRLICLSPSSSCMAAARA